MERYFVVKRWPFTDGWNTATHMAAGAATSVSLLVAPVFLFYQFVLSPPENITVDIGEYLVGYLAARKLGM